MGLLSADLPLTGECLFPGGVGKTWRPGDFTQLLDDVTTRVFDVYADSTIIYPGHGDDTMLGDERPHLAEWGQRGWVTLPGTLRGALSADPAGNVPGVWQQT